MIRPDHDLWVFGYGSLMWRPGFVFEEEQPARLHGAHRSLCIYSHVHRGTPERPGLVLGLDRGGTCLGVAYRVASSEAPGILAYLRAREQVSGVYREAFVQVELLHHEPREVLALAYIVERRHPSYARRLSLAQQAQLVRGARGISGSNLDYLINTLRHLAELGIHEPELARLLSFIGPHVARHEGATLASPRALALMRASRSRPVRVPLLKPDQRRRFTFRQRLGAGASANRSSAAKRP